MAMQECVSNCVEGFEWEEKSKTERNRFLEDIEIFGKENNKEMYILWNMKAKVRSINIANVVRKWDVCGVNENEQHIVDALWTIYMDKDR